MGWGGEGLERKEGEERRREGDFSTCILDVATNQHTHTYTNIYTHTHMFADTNAVTQTYRDTDTDTCKGMEASRHPLFNRAILPTSLPSLRYTRHNRHS